MKKSAKVTLTVVAVVGLASCRSRRDPCDQSYFSELACQDAVRSGGYYWGGSWYPMMYHYPYPYYYDSYRSYLSRGGTVRMAPYGSYGRPGGSVSTPSSTPRGGFGSTGAGHSSGGGE